MDKYTYPKITPADVFLPYFDRPLTEAELWMGVTRNPFGNRPSGCRFVDHFAGLIRRYGDMDLQDIARRLGTDPPSLSYTIATLTDRLPREWVDYWVISATCQMLEQTDWEVKRIAKELNVSSASALARRFRRAKGVAPGVWRAAASGR